MDLHGQPPPLRCRILWPSSFGLVLMLLFGKVPLWKYYILIYNVQKSLWFTNLYHIPNINCFFSVEGELSYGITSSFLICPSTEHLAPWGTPTWEIQPTKGRDEVRLEQLLHTIQPGKDNELGCGCFSHPTLLPVLHPARQPTVGTSKPPFWSRTHGLWWDVQL